MKQPARGRLALPAAAATATAAALVAAAASGLWISSTPSGGGSLIGNASGSGGNRGGGAPVGVVGDAGEEETDSQNEIPLNTIVVVDAGSSGCRLNVYRVAGERDSMEVSGFAGGKIEPGLSSFADSPRDAATHILPLLSSVSDHVPKDGHARTRVFIRSTAGMRLLPREVQDAIYDEIYEALVGHPRFPFTLRRGDLGTIDGDKEAFYAVLSANYLKGRIDALLRPTGHEAGEMGALDMGGASTQIIFKHPERSRQSTTEGSYRNGREDSEGPDGDKREGFEEDIEAGEGRGNESTGPVSETDFWGASHLGYGVSEVRSKIWSYLVERHSSSAGDASGVKEVVNPCSFVDRVDVWEDHRLIGSGDHALCEAIVSEVLWGRDESKGGESEGEMEERRRGIGGVSMPAVSGDFLAMSVFFYATHCLRELGPAELSSWPEPTLAELRHAAEGFCAMEWEEVLGDQSWVMNSKHTSSEEALAHRCVEVVYITTLLRDGYGFPEHSRNVTFALESDGMEVEWTLGYALVELADALEPPEASGTCFSSEFLDGGVIEVGAGGNVH